MSPLPAILSAVILVSLISLVGIFFLGFSEQLLTKLLMGLVGFSSGALIGTAFLHLLPHSLELSHVDLAFQLTILGMVLFFLMEKFLCWRHCHEGRCDVHSFAYLNLFGDGIHNFIDGMVIAASFLVTESLGVATTLAVIFHELPQEMGDFGVLVYAGIRKSKALAYNFLSALTAVAGAVLTFYVSAFLQDLVTLLIPFTAGGFIYIAATDLMPQLHKKSSSKDALTQLTSIVLGLVLMWTLRATG